MYLSLAPITVHIERSFYTVQESCTMLSVTLVVVGEVREEFTVRVITDPFTPSARGIKESEICLLHYLCVLCLV